MRLFGCVHGSTPLGQPPISPRKPLATNTTPVPLLHHSRSVGPPRDAADNSVRLTVGPECGRGRRVTKKKKKKKVKIELVAQVVPVVLVVLVELVQLVVPGVLVALVFLVVGTTGSATGATSDFFSGDKPLGTL